ncbi:hypothetical protein H6G33_10310 [Calothrix sp. FACHB-1219]|uniref:hypothetical protein n=1 Tax=unclassified Calothrix TaxID=2619626 RepID=UPI00168282D3|nr:MULTISPECIES: hypothetical protein [unclassified Calothrix]MBD2201739.1 hypothetical protein [Calothrix sp. FACHB-168]MBD2217425.1 hypothetical protein [Calothrix sp. FACHB-1219]
MNVANGLLVLTSVLVIGVVLKKPLIKEITLWRNEYIESVEAKEDRKKIYKGKETALLSGNTPIKILGEYDGRIKHSIKVLNQETGEEMYVRREDIAE